MESNNHKNFEPFSPYHKTIQTTHKKVQKINEKQLFDRNITGIDK